MNTKRNSNRVHVLSACCLVGLIGLAGCSGQVRDKWRDGLPPAHPASGRVDYDGTPLEGATVVFVTTVPGSKRTIAATGRTDSSGQFVLRTYRPGDGAIVGSHQVMISKSVMVTESGKPAVPNAQGEILDATVEKSLIPEKYRSPADSGLDATVVAGSRNEFTFSLSAK